MDRPSTKKNSSEHAATLCHHEEPEGFRWFTAETLRTQREEFELKNLCVLCAAAVNSVLLQVTALEPSC